MSNGGGREIHIRGADPASLFLRTIVLAQTVKSQITAKNGVIIDLNADKFANRYEYSAPMIGFQVGNAAVESFALVAKTKSKAVMGKLNVQGAIYFGGTGAST